MRPNFDSVRWNRRAMAMRECSPNPDGMRDIHLSFLARNSFSPTYSSHIVIMFRGNDALWECVSAP